MQPLATPHDPSSPHGPKVVLERLDEVRAQLEAMSEQAEGYKQMQETFHLAPHEFTQLRDTISQYELKHEIWTRFDMWHEAQAQWRGEPFHELDVEEMVKEVQQCGRWFTAPPCPRWPPHSCRRPTPPGFTGRPTARLRTSERSFWDRGFGVK